MYIFPPISIVPRLNDNDRRASPTASVRASTPKASKLIGKLLSSDERRNHVVMCNTDEFPVPKSRYRIDFVESSLLRLVDEVKVEAAT